MISVCLASYNGAAFIQEQILSILPQLGPTDELIVSDDYSTDATVQLIEEIGDGRIRIYRNEGRKSVVGNFENALKKSTGDFIFLADQDDVWLPNKVARMMQELQQADLVVSDCLFIDEQGRVSDTSFYQVYRSGRGVLKNFVKNSYLGNCMAFRRPVLERALPFPEQLYELANYYVYHDIWLGLLADLSFRVVFLPDRLSYFRRHSGNVSPTESLVASPNSLGRKLRARSLLASAFLGRVLNR